MECCIRWPGLHKSLELNPTELVWDQLDPRSEGEEAVNWAPLGTPSKTVGKPFQVTTSWSWLRECQECVSRHQSKKVATLKNLKSKTYSGLFNTFFVFFHSFDVCSINLQYRKIIKITKNHWLRWPLTEYTMPVCVVVVYYILTTTQTGHYIQPKWLPLSSAATYGVKGHHSVRWICVI